MHQNSQDMPQWIFNGGMGNHDADYKDLNWDGYEIADSVADYYKPGDGRMVVYKRK